MLIDTFLDGLELLLNRLLLFTQLLHESTALHRRCQAHVPPLEVALPFGKLEHELIERGVSLLEVVEQRLGSDGMVGVDKPPTLSHHSTFGNY